MRQEQLSTLRGTHARMLPDSRTTRPADHGNGRACEICGAVLSRYNPNPDRCWAHRRPTEPKEYTRRKKERSTE